MRECYQHGGHKTSFPDDPCVRFTSIEKRITYLLLSFQLQQSILIIKIGADYIVKLQTQMLKVIQSYHLHQNPLPQI